MSSKKIPVGLPTKLLDISLIPKDLRPGSGVVLAHATAILEGDQETDYSVITEDGELYFCFGTQFKNGTDKERIEYINHEIGHILYSHGKRMGDRDPHLWNIATDAAQHASNNDGCFHIHPEAPTWDRLGLSNAASAEIMYDMMKQKQKQAEENGEPDPYGSSSSCGSMMISINDMDPAAAQALLVPMVAEIMACDPDMYAALTNSGHSGGQGTGAAQSIGTIPPPPKWIRKSLKWLISACARRDPRRSWMRENRNSHLLPGRHRTPGYSPVVLIDSSGSVPSEDLKMFFSAIANTPELSEAKIYTFDGEVYGPYRAHQLKELAPTRGGTSFTVAAKMREKGKPTLWLTDGYPCDGWPKAEDDIWCITSDVTPPYGKVIKARG